MGENVELLGGESRELEGREKKCTSWVADGQPAAVSFHHEIGKKARCYIVPSKLHDIAMTIVMKKLVRVQQCKIYILLYIICCVAFAKDI